MAALADPASPSEPSACCGLEAQSTCCEPSAKADCCTPEATGCGCAAGSPEPSDREFREVVREKHAAAATGGCGSEVTTRTTDASGAHVWGAAL
jgi:hypothetical protein